MIVKVKVMLRASQERIEKQADGSHKAWIRVAPDKGKANERLQELLSEYFEVSKSRINIVSGHTSRNKVIEISK